MHVLWTVVVDDGTRPYGPGISVDQRRPLRMTIGEDTLIDIRLINPVGGEVLLSGGDFVVINARTSRIPNRQIFTKRSTPIADGLYRITVAADDTKNQEPQPGEFDLWLVKGSGRAMLIPLSELELAPSALGKNYL